MEFHAESLLWAFVYLVVPMLIFGIYEMWHWSKDTEKYVKVWLATKTGGSKTFLAPREGGSVTIDNPETGDVRTWPVNELATIDTLYPGVGFLPKFMQKNIRTIFFSEGDWEPVLNRSPHGKRIASPDVIEFMKQLGEKNATIKKMVEAYLEEGISTGPTREMVADPATLGSLFRNAVLKALASVSNDLLETLKSINQRLTKIMGPNPMIVYIGLGLILIVSIFGVYQLMQLAPQLESNTDMIQKIDAIYKSLGLAGK